MVSSAGGTNSNIACLGEEVDDLMEVNEVADSLLRRRSWFNGSGWKIRSLFRRFLNVTSWKNFHVQLDSWASSKKILTFHSKGIRWNIHILSKFKHNAGLYVYACDVYVMKCDVIIGQVWFHLIEGKQLNDDSSNSLIMYSYLIAFMLEHRQSF